jgi:tRNA U34 5-methylaminomethyl-2-thiouridine-forming methyltransferase MnmC
MNPTQESVIFETSDGSHSLRSSTFGVSYHSKYGAVQESLHVFIQAGLYYKALQTTNIAVLELGFGTGLNALLTLLHAEMHGWQIDYETIEAYPISIEQAAQLNYPELLGVADHRSTFMHLHQMDWGVPIQAAPHFRFCKQQIDFQHINYQQRFDLLYFDTFAPDTQPELWETPMLLRAWHALRDGGVFVTYCAKGVVKRRLCEVGFEVESIPGPPGKREMTRAVKR